MNGAKSLATAVAVSCVLWSVEAAAMCGCFVQPAPEGQTAPDLYADATQVALARDGTRTVLTMQNNYKGPVKDFALVIPVPEVLEQQDVSVIDPTIFGRMDALTAPRLFEVEEQDPCPELGGPGGGGGFGVPVSFEDSTAGGRGGGGGSETPPEVVVEAQFDVDAYEVVILSAEDSTGLLTWLTGNGYDVPEETADVLQGYITQGMYFFVAKVDPAKVAFADGEAVLPPLRFEYDSEEFTLPVRLGTVNSPGSQDIIAYIVSDEGRFETANYEQIVMPTNVEVAADVRDDFGGFYRALYDEAAQGEAAFSATEFSVTSPAECWDCGFGWVNGSYYADVSVLMGADSDGDFAWDQSLASATLTRLHVRVGADGPVEDVVFKKASALWGGMNSVDGLSDFEEREPSWANGRSQFMSRYVIRNYWTGPVRCGAPTWGRWQAKQSAEPLSAPSPNNGGTTASSEEPLDRLVRQDLPTIGLTTTNPPPEPGELASGCGCAAPGSGGAPAGGLALFALGVFGVRRARRARHG